MRGKLIMCGDSKALTEPKDHKRVRREHSRQTREWRQRQTEHLSAAKAGMRQEAS